MKRVRWECPNGHGGTLGPQRPRRDDICRYCLTCSAERGRLVDRVAPVLLKKKSERKAKETKRRKEKIAKSRKRYEELFTVAGVHLVEEMCRFRSLKAFKGTRLGRYIPTLKVRLASKKVESLGRAWPGRWMIQIVNYPGITAEDVRETLLHELAHLATPHHGHDVRWKAVFRCACEEAFGVRPRLPNRYHGEVTALIREKRERNDLSVLVGMRPLARQIGEWSFSGQSVDRRETPGAIVSDGAIDSSALDSQSVSPSPEVVR